MLLNLSLLGTLGLVGIAAAKTISVEVGDPAFKFSQEEIAADVGDIITFTVHPTHNVVEGNGFANPCSFKPGGFFSGFSTAETPFTIAVTSTDPIWLYCSADSHCQGGMVAVINPPSGANNLAAYKAAAQDTTSSSDPGSRMGEFTPPESSSSSSSASSSAPESSASSSASSASSSSAPTSKSSAPASSKSTTTPTAGTNATVSHTVAPPPVVQTTNAAVSTFTEETVLVNVFMGLVAVVAGWVGLL